jgi:hypothetical protein
MRTESKFDVNLVMLDDIVVTNATINNPENIKLSESKYNITFEFTPGVNIPEKKIRIIFSCEIQAESPADRATLITAKFDLAYYFKVDNLNDLISEHNEGQEIVIDKEVSISLSNIAYSTSRGIIFTRCQGTALGKVIIPILSTDKIVSIFSDTE